MRDGLALASSNLIAIYLYIFFTLHHTTRCINKKLSPHPFTIPHTLPSFSFAFEGSRFPRFFFKKILAFFLESQLPLPPWLAWTSWASCWPRQPWGAASWVPCRSRKHQGHQHRNRWKAWEHHKWRIRRMRVAGNWKMVDMLLLLLLLLGVSYVWWLEGGWRFQDVNFFFADTGTVLDWIVRTDILTENWPLFGHLRKQCI